MSHEETKQESAAVDRSPSLEYASHAEADPEDTHHRKQSSLASLALVEPPTGPERSSQPPSPADSNDFKSPELQSVALEELSLDDSETKKPPHLSLERVEGTASDPVEDSLATAKPREDETSPTIPTPSGATHKSAPSLDSLLSPVEESFAPHDAPSEDETSPTIPTPSGATHKSAPSLDSLLSPVKESFGHHDAPSEDEDAAAAHHVAPAEKAASPTADLDSLLSPTKDTEFKFPTRASVTASDVTDDEARFSTVLLSAHQSLDPANPPSLVGLSEKLNETLAGLPEETVEEAEAATRDERRDTMDGNEIVRLVHQNRVHKKTASTSTIMSANNVPFILARLEGEEGSRRTSQDGKQKLQEEFDKKHVSMERDEGTTVDWGFWGDVVSDYQAYAAAYPQQLAKAIERGIPKSLRGMIWQLMSASKDPELEQTYLRLLKESSTHEKAISRDLGRTFPHHAFFTDGHGIGQENLFNVLKAYSLYDPEVGYCQGLPFVVAILLLNMPDEEAFCLLVRLMHSYDLRGHFLPEMPQLQKRMFQFDRLVEELLPVLHVHFIRQGVKSSMYCSQWFLTMFSYKFPLDIVFRIYDNVLASGIEALFSFSLCLLYKNEETLLNMKFDQLLVFLNTKMLDIYQVGVVEGEGTTTPIYDIDLYVQDAVSMSITPFMLDQYANEYEELVRTRDAQMVEMDSLRNSNRALSAQVHNLETDLAQLNAEHVKILNELVMARLRHEELEAELVRYKLLYAEAMHKSEDALSSQRVSMMSMFSRRSSSNTGSN